MKGILPRRTSPSSLWHNNSTPPGLRSGSVPQAHAIRGDVIEVVEVDAAHGEGAQRVETKVGRASPLPAALGSGTAAGAHGVTRPTRSPADTAAARSCQRAFGKNA